MFSNAEKQIELHLIKAMKAAPSTPVDFSGKKSTPQPEALNHTFYRKAAICYLCGQPVEQEQEAPFRIPQGDVVCDKTCLMLLQSGVWELLENQGVGEPMHYDDGSSDDLLPDETQITPYLVAPLDKLDPAVSLNKQWHDQEQQVHNSH